MKEGLPKGVVLTYACLGFVIGTGVFSFSVFCPQLYCAMLALVFVFLFAILKTRKRWLGIIVIIIAGFWIGGWRYTLTEQPITPQHIRYYNGRTVTFQGVVFKEPIQSATRQQFVISVDSADGISFPVKGLVQASTLPYPRYLYGDRLALTCKLEKPENKDFAYDRYLARYNIYSLCNRPKISVLEHGKGGSFIAFLIAVKQRSYSIAQTYMPEPTASLALPVVFGGGQGIDDDITESFRRTGLTHIMAVSGFNVSLLAVLLGAGFMVMGLGRKAVFYASSLTIAAYVIMVGAPASAVRAGVMSILILLALTLGRMVDFSRSILLVAVMTLLVNPRLLRDDIGWQLSFLALLGLVYILPYLETWTLKLTKNKGKAFVTALMATVAAQLSTAPVILYNFGQFSIIAPIANLLVVWVVPILTIAMMAALPLAALFPSLGMILFFPSWLMVKYIFFIVQLLASVSWASISFS